MSGLYLKHKRLTRREYDSLRTWNEEQPWDMSNYQWQKRLRHRFKGVFRETIGAGSLRRVLASKSFNEYHKIGIVDRVKNVFR